MIDGKPDPYSLQHASALYTNIPHEFMLETITANTPGWPV